MITLNSVCVMEVMKNKQEQQQQKRKTSFNKDKFGPVEI